MNYHITQEQAVESAMGVASGRKLESGNRVSYILTTEELQAFANAVLDQVLGEPVGYVNEHSLEMLKDSQQAKACATLWRTGIWDSANVALYAPKEQS